MDWPETLSGRIKKVITRSGTRRRYAVPCYRYGNREAHCEAAEEATACILLDACPDIEFQEQPLRLTFQWCGEAHQHIPDLLVACGTRYEFWECKRTGEASQFRIRKRSERLREILAPLKIRYRVVTGQELLAGSYSANARLIRRFATRSVSEWVRLEANLRTQRASTMTLGALVDVLDAEDSACDVLALIYEGALSVDMSVLLTRESAIYPPASEGSEPWVWQIFDQVNE